MTTSAIAERPVRFLFVDDDAAILRALVDICAKERDFVATTAEDAGAALVSVDRKSPDVVVTDHRMPGTTGVELLTQLRAKRPEIVRVLLTADPQRDVAQRALLDGGVHAIIGKPWQLRSLVAVLRGAALQARMLRVGAVADPAAALRAFSRAPRQSTTAAKRSDDFVSGDARPLTRP